MLNIELLKSMDLDHAINALRIDFDPLVNTPLEQHLLDRLEALADCETSESPVIEEANEHDLSSEDIETLGDALIVNAEATAALLGVLSAAGYDSVGPLKADLQKVKQLNDIANDAGDIFTRITTLISQE